MLCVNEFQNIHLSYLSALYLENRFVCTESSLSTVTSFMHATDFAHHVISFVEVVVVGRCCWVSSVPGRPADLDNRRVYHACSRCGILGGLDIVSLTYPVLDSMSCVKQMEN